jgi:hypothetical protein
VSLTWVSAHYQYNTAVVYNKGNLLSAKYNRCVDQGGFGISRIPQLCRTRGIWHQRNAAGVKDKRDFVSAQCNRCVDQGDLVSAQYSRCVGHGGFGISAMRQVLRTRGILYQHSATGG